MNSDVVNLVARQVLVFSILLLFVGLLQLDPPRCRGFSRNQTEIELQELTSSFSVVAIANVNTPQSNR